MSAEFAVVRSGRPAGAEERAAILAAPGFGQHFTDHMAAATWTAEGGWEGHKVGPLEPYQLHPSAAVLHYAQEIFEGLKAYRHDDGSVWLFRPEVNARRFARSARRLALPVLPEDDFVTSVATLVEVDEPWVPAPEGEESLYLRPFMFASEAFLGVRPASRVEYAVIASPAGPYFESGVTGVTLWVTSTYTRAAEGGTGAAKCGGNYAGSLAAQREAAEHGCDQVLYLDSAGKGNLEESGTMNLLLITSDGRLVTPELGTILEGVTRDTLLALAGEHGLTPVERSVSIGELRAGVTDGTFVEVFAAGTAAVVTPITGFKGEGGGGEGYEFTVGDGSPGRKTVELREHVLDIQYGRAQDTHGWLHRVC
ncbi:branched-chain amino acid aminotransferase [Streptomyces spirodelae]|uniref:branched-chain-amino-acid transaminase n=1 Tax=Streptomyces spirodelae TaxID=2812904 RepID=A0ABS3X3R5_9ACTN|nr:branched-chain amino acid aminotransferase [Streptomyces spirodelae]MBO8190028.1 branched-chain amino acid aminotransferase [Streptomyces spirodelae]